jgi:glycosyltransferase involved in cell wall biosynthesis
MSADPICLRLLTPPPTEHAAGGHRYGAQLVAALRDAGHDAALVPLPGRFPLPDDAARAGAVQAWAGLPAGVVPVIDALGLAAFDGVALARPAIGLFHHATPLRNDVDETARATLAEARGRALAGLAGIVASSASTLFRLTTEDGLPAARVRVVSPGLPAWPRAPGSGGPGCHIISIGGLVPRKGHDRLLRALARLFDLDWRLTIIGTPHRRPAHAAALVELARTLDVAARVTFAGDLDEAGREAVWQTADLFALATAWEASGMAAAEALRRGVPVAVTAGGEAAAAVTPACGIVTDVDDVDGLSKAMRRLVFSAALRRDFADGAWAAGQALPGWPEQAQAFVEAVRALQAA